MKIIISLEILWLQIFRDQLQGGSHVVGEGPFGVSSRDEAHCPAGAFRSFQKVGLDTKLLEGALVQVSQFVVADLADEARRHSEY